MATTLTAENKEYIPSKWETTPCMFCDSTESHFFERFGYQHRYQFVQCAQCGLAYQNPRPAYDESFIETAYEVYSTYNGFKTADSLTPKGKIVYKEYSYNLSEIESFTGKTGNLLEIGCNTGFFCKVAADRGWKVVGVEVSNTMAKLANETYGVETRVGDWSKMNFSTRFDAIYCSHVIEHIPNPKAWMQRFKEVLAPGGIVCLSVPNMGSIDRKFKRFLKRIGLKKDHWAKWRTPDHLYEPSEKAMLQFIESCGFEVLRKYSYPSEWTGKVSLWHALFHFRLRWAAKSRYYIHPI